MKILCIKDHVHNSINDFHERVRAITNPTHSRSFELKKKEEEEEEYEEEEDDDDDDDDDKQSVFYKFPRISVAV